MRVIERFGVSAFAPVSATSLVTCDSPAFTVPGGKPVVDVPGAHLSLMTPDQMVMVELPITPKSAAAPSDAVLAAAANIGLSLH